MRVNGQEALACVCLLAEYGEEITVEPLTNFPVSSDVVVDMESFYERSETSVRSSATARCPRRQNRRRI